MKSVSDALRVFHYQLKRISMPLTELVREFNAANRHIRGVNKTIDLYESNMRKNQEAIKSLGGEFARSLKELSNATTSASNSIQKASLAANAGGGGKASGITGLLGMKIGSGGGGFGELFGRMVGAGAVMSAYSGTRQIFDITDP